MSIAVYAFCNIAYKRQCLNWISHIQSIGIENFKIVCHDHEIYKFLVNDFPDNLEHHKKYYYDIKHKGKIIAKPYWQFRKEILVDLLRREEVILFSDLDAVWLQSPIELFSELLNTHDIIFSKVEHARAWPAKIRKAIGFTVCMGLFLAKSNSKTLALFDRLLNSKIDDDQDAMNRILFDNRFDLKNSPDTISFSYNNIRIAVLSSNIVARPFDKAQFRGAQIVHPFCPVTTGKNTSPKARQNKQVKILKEYGLWNNNL